MGNSCVTEADSQMNPDLMMSMKVRARTNRAKAKNAQEVDEDLKFNQLFESNIIDPYPMNYDSLNTTNQSNNRGYYTQKTPRDMVYKSELQPNKQPLPKENKTQKNIDGQKQRENNNNEDNSVFTQNEKQPLGGNGIVIGGSETNNNKNQKQVTFGQGKHHIRSKTQKVNTKRRKVCTK